MQNPDASTSIRLLESSLSSRVMHFFAARSSRLTVKKYSPLFPMSSVALLALSASCRRRSERKIEQAMQRERGVKTLRRGEFAVVFAILSPSLKRSRRNNRGVSSKVRWVSTNPPEVTRNYVVYCRLYRKEQDLPKRGAQIVCTHFKVHYSAYKMYAWSRRP